MEWLLDPNALVALATLTALEIVLGIDNIIFISILVGRLPATQRNSARRLGLLLAMGSRIALLVSLAWIMRLTAPLFEILGNEISGRDIILIVGGLFLLWKSVHEIHHSLTYPVQEEHHEESKKQVSYMGVLAQIAVIDIVFSLDSVITAVGLVDQIPVMICAILLSVAMMMVAAKPIGEFVDANPTIKMLALSFLVMVGVTLIAEGFETHVPKGYIYFAMAFSVAVEMINIRLRKRMSVKLNKDGPDFD
ncbi:TerC family protein [Uliginosibacterium sp. sgz301328]|uniref:TerC family protein n=1 Tax=Uliginosibacterium sp. sgz301328 TaxID=3243764 RepID=UPI00359E0C9C